MQAGIYPMAEHTTQTEGVDAVAGCAVHQRRWMSHNRSGRGRAMAGVAAIANHLGPRVIRVRTLEGLGGVTGTAL